MKLKGAFLMPQSKDEQRELFRERDYKVVKSNDLIQKSRFQLSLQEQKIILYLISKIKPDDIVLKEQIFEINDFFKICGLKDGGASYKYVKQTLKDLRDRSIWVTLDNGAETTLAWIDKVTMDKPRGAVVIKIDEMMKPYLLQLKDRFTQYELFYTLAMKSQYSIRLYEILKSYENQKQKKFDIDELKKMLSAEKYKRYPDFRRYVLDISLREINAFSDVNVTYQVIKDKRRYANIVFSTSQKKGLNERLETWERIDGVLNPMQTSLFSRT
jgi:plasmid replication initiation protein